MNIALPYDNHRTEKNGERVPGFLFPYKLYAKLKDPAINY